MPKQILRVDHESYIAQFIRFMINTSEELGQAGICFTMLAAAHSFSEKEKQQDSDTLEARDARYDFGNIKLGTPSKQITIQDMLSSVSDDLRFSGFRDKLMSFLKEALKDSKVKPAMLTVHNQTKVGNFLVLECPNLVLNKRSFRLHRLDSLKSAMSPLSHGVPAQTIFAATRN